MPRVAALKLTPKANGGWSARKRIPADVAAEYERQYGKSSEEWFSCAPMRAGDAGRKAAEWRIEIETRIANIRAARTGVGRTLSRQEALALAGDWYRWFVGRHEADAGDPRGWEAHWLNYWDDLEELAPKSVWQASQDDDQALREWVRSEKGRAVVRHVVADKAATSQFLARQGLLLTHEARDLFLDCVTDEVPEALKRLEQLAKDDYSPDQRLERYPKLRVTNKADPKSGDTPMDLFRGWVAEAKPANQTVNRWRCVLEHLQQHFAERSAGSITAEEAQAWADGLLADGTRSHDTVIDVWRSAARRVFGWGQKKKKIDSNPFAQVEITRPKKKRTRPQHFRDDEVALILRSARAIQPKSPIDAAKRWVCWLCAYTGARPGEITQLRGIDVKMIESHWSIEITPEAGTVKNKEARTVPLHEHLIAEGFLAFVKSSGHGPLFYTPANAGKATRDDPTNPVRSRPEITRTRIGEWARKIGATDKGVRPSHAWRHTFKVRADRADISEKTSDFITGHKAATVGRRYGAPTVADMAQALKKFPRYDIDVSAPAFEESWETSATAPASNSRTVAQGED